MEITTLYELCWQEKNGDLSALVKDLEASGVRKALLKQAGLGILIGIPIYAGATYAIKKANDYIKNRAMQKQEDYVLTKDTDETELEEI